MTFKGGVYTKDPSVQVKPKLFYIKLKAPPDFIEGVDQGFVFVPLYSNILRPGSDR